MTKNKFLAYGYNSRISDYDSMLDAMKDRIFKNELWRNAYLFFYNFPGEKYCYEYEVELSIRRTKKRGIRRYIDV